MSDNRRRFHDQSYVHFITFSVYKRRQLLDLDVPRKMVLGVLNHQLDAFGGKCVGFVLMPNHVHALLWVPDSESMPRFLHGWKRMSSYTNLKWYAEHAPRYFDGFGSGNKFWQAKSYVFQVHSEHKLREKLNYIHENPVRAGLVTRAIDWPWSSARWYICGRTVGVPLEWIEGS